MEIVIGTYEEFLVGYSLKKKKDQFSLEQSFTNHAHCGSVRSLASSGKYLASGSIDEGVHIISMKHRVDAGTLIAHSGTITALEFLRSAYLFSASEDGNICIWNAKKQWECEKILRGHKDAVNSVSIHSSGKLLISVSKDKTLRTWNLIKGRCAYIVNLKEVAHQVLWSPSSLYFAVVFDYHVDIYDLSTGGILDSIDKKHFDSKRINRVLFADDSNIILSGDCNEIVIYNFVAQMPIAKFTLHENRIKDLAWVNLNTLSSDLIDQESVDSSAKWLVSTSSDGFIKVWSFDFSKLSTKPTLVTQVNSTCRPTCLAVWTSNQNSNEKFNAFTLPELKLSKEELEVCKAKLKKEKKLKRKLEEANEETKGPEEQEQKQGEQNKAAASKPKTNKKAKTEEQIVVPLTVPKKVDKPSDEDEEDDEEAIKKMKATSENYKQLNKYRKGKKRNMETFRSRLQKQKGKRDGGGFKVYREDSEERKPPEHSGRRRLLIPQREFANKSPTRNKDRASNGGGRGRGKSSRPNRSR